MSTSTINGNERDEVEPAITPRRYAVVIGNEVVYGCETANEAVEFTDKHPDGIVYGKLSDEPEGERRGVMPEANPVAHAIYSLSQDSLKKARSLIGEVGYVDHFHNSGLTELARPNKSTGREDRRATNEECATLFIKVKVYGSIDLRSDLFAQLAEWARENAEQFTELAEQFDKTEDTRNLYTINEVIDDKRFLEKLRRGGKEIGWDGEICASSERRMDREVEEHLYAAFRDRQNEIEKTSPSFVRPRFYGVVDPDSVLNPTRSLESAEGFARGRGGHSIVVGFVDAVEGGAA